MFRVPASGWVLETSHGIHEIWQVRPFAVPGMDADSQMSNLVIETFQLLVLPMDEAAYRIRGQGILGRSRWHVSRGKCEDELFGIMGAEYSQCLGGMLLVTQ